MKLSCIDAIAPGATLKEKCDNLAKYGFDGIEIWTGSGSSKQQEKEIVEIAAQGRIKPSSVLLVNEAFYRPLDSQEAMQAKAEAAKESLRLAAAIDAVSLLIPEYCPQLPPPIMIPPLPGEAEEGLLLKLLGEAARYAGEVEATLVLEPINRYETRFFHTLDEAVAICKDIGSSTIKVMADLFQMNIEERDIAVSIKRAGDFIHHVHLSDSNRLLPGYGNIDFHSVFAALKEIEYEGYITLECAIHGNAEELLPGCVEHLKRCMQ